MPPDLPPDPHGSAPAPEIADSEAADSHASALDIAFYKSYYADMRDLSDARASEHWHHLGIHEGRFPSLEALLVPRLRGLAPLPPEFSVAVYKFLNPDLLGVFTHDWEYVLHYIDCGRQEGRRHEVPDDAFLRSLYPREDGGIAAALSRGTPVYRDLKDMLGTNGILSLDFIAAFSASDYITVSGESALTDDLRCLRHFCEQGRQALLPISLECRFDPGFYLANRPDAPTHPPDMYLHWLNVGYPAGVKPNASLFMKDLGLRHTGRFPEAVDPDIYQCLNPDLRATLTGKWDALRHVVLYGLLERRPGVPGPAQAPDVYLAAADRLAVQNRLAEAKHLYESVLSVDPANGFAAQHYADCLYRLDEHAAAIIAYQHVIAIGKAGHWTHINLAECLRKTSRYAEATQTLAARRRQYPGDLALARRTWEAARFDYDRGGDTAAQLARAGLLTQARRVLAQAAESLKARTADALSVAPGDRPPVANRATGPVRSVLIVADMNLPQCRFYRVDQKAYHLRNAGLAVEIVNCWESLDHIPDLLFGIDVAIFYRVAALPAVLRAIHAVRAAGIPTFYDIDDLIFDEAHYPDSFESYGGQITPDEYAGLVTGTGLFRVAMSACDYALASTRALAAIMAPIVISGRAYVHRNGLSPVHLSWHGRRARPDADDMVRIFYGSGTKAHNDDFETLVAPSLRRLLDAAPKGIQVVLMGYLTLPDCLKPHAAQIIQLPPVWDVAVYWNLLSRMDINIAVLKRNVTTDCKSEIKWLEAGMFAIPSIVSRTATYEDVVADGVDGMLVSTAEEWHAALTALIGDRAARERIGAAAAAKIAAHYSIPAFSQNLLAMFDEISDAPKNVARMRVLIVNVFFPPQAHGGATRVVADNVDEILALHGGDIEIEVFTTTEGGDRPYGLRTYRWNGVKVTGVTASNEPDVDVNPHDPRMYEIFGAYLDAFKPDLVHFHCIQRLTGAVCQAARDRGIPYYVSLHDGWWISDQQFLLDEFLRPRLYDVCETPEMIRNFGAKGLHRMAVLAEHLRAAEAILPVSASFAALYRDRGFTNVVAVPNGVSDVAVQPRLPSPSGRVRIGHIGGKSAHKGFNLLKATLLEGDFAHLEVLVIDHALAPGVEITEVWGTTPVRFRATVPQPEVGHLYAEIDVLAAPSLWPESYGLVVREALLAGCWVIVSDRGALAEDVTADNGFVVDVGGTAALAGVLREIDRSHRRFLASPRLKTKLRRSADQARDLAHLYLERFSGRGDTSPAARGAPEHVG